MVELAVVLVERVLMCGLGLVPLSCPLELAAESAVAAESAAVELAVAAEPAVVVELAVVLVERVLMCGLGLVPLLRPLELAVELAVLLVVQQVQLVVERHYKTTGY